MADVKDALQVLHTRVIDSREGYEQAQENIDGNGSFVERCIEERASFHEAIHRQMTAEGIDVDESGSTAAMAHRGLFRIRDALSSGDSGIYAECARGDEHLKSAYDDAIEATRGDAIWDFLVEQRAKVDAAIKEAKALS